MVLVLLKYFEVIQVPHLNEEQQSQSNNFSHKREASERKISVPETKPACLEATKVIKSEKFRYNYLIFFLGVEVSRSKDAFSEG